MIVWGGGSDGGEARTQEGGTIPATDTWTATSIINAPHPRSGHTAVWTGSDMIVWGGEGNGHNPLNTGGRYDPGTDSWITTRNTNAPTRREGHTAVWTFNEMIVWGGIDVTGSGDLNTGGRYCEVTYADANAYSNTYCNPPTQLRLQQQHLR